MGKIRDWFNNIFGEKPIAREKREYQWFENGVLQRGTMKEHEEYIKRLTTESFDEDDYDPDTYPREF